MIQTLGVPGSRGGMGFQPSEIDALSVFGLLFWYKTHMELREAEESKKDD